MNLTPNQRLAQLLLGEDVDLIEWLLHQHDEGVPASVVARKLADRTGGQVNVTAQAVRNWIAQFQATRNTEDAGAA